MGIIKDFLTPQIFLIEDRGQFVYTRGRLRIVFDHLELFEDLGTYNDINNLYFLRPREVEEYTGGNIVFDLQGKAIACIPYNTKSFFYGSNSIYLYRDSQSERMAMSRFIKEQHEILAKSTKEKSSSK